MMKSKNKAAQSLAYLRAKSLTPKQRSEIARKAGKAGGRGRAKKKKGEDWIEPPPHGWEK